ncbi:MAG: hypothetical protein ACRCS4_00700 [Flavobacterium sp.]
MIIEFWKDNLNPITLFGKKMGDSDFEKKRIWKHEKGEDKDNWICTTELMKRYKLSRWTTLKLMREHNIEEVRFVGTRAWFNMAQAVKVIENELLNK